MNDLLQKNSAKVPNWQLRLYVAGQSIKTRTAVDNITSLCTKVLGDNYKLMVIDLLEKPQLAEQDEVLAVPMLVRKHPHPVRKIVGDLSNVDLVSTALDFKRIFPDA